MCLMLYLATAEEIPLQSSPELGVEKVETSRDAVRAWFSLPHVRYIGSHSGCSCGFPSIQSETPVEYYEGMLFESKQREKDLRSVRALIELISPIVRSGCQVELYPIWDLEEHMAPIGTIEWQSDELDAGTFFFHQQFLHRVRR